MAVNFRGGGGTFADSPQTTKFAKVFSLESFPLHVYGIVTRSLDYYYSLVFWINYSICLLYVAIKYLVAPVFWILLEKANKADQGSCLTKFAKITKPMRWLILQLFGGPLGIVEQH